MNFPKATMQRTIEDNSPTNHITINLKDCFSNRQFGELSAYYFSQNCRGTQRETDPIAGYRAVHLVGFYLIFLMLWHKYQEWYSKGTPYNFNRPFFQINYALFVICKYLKFTYHILSSNMDLN